MGSENHREFDQCVKKHVSLGLDCLFSGAKFRIPSRNRVDVIATALRAGEYAQAQELCEVPGETRTLAEFEISAALRGDMNIGGDRSYKKMGFSFKEARPGSSEICIRIFGFDKHEETKRVAAYRNCDDDSFISPTASINLVVSQ